MKNASLRRLSRRRRMINKAAHLFVLIVLALVWLVPVVFVLLSSFKTDAEMTLRKFSWLPLTWNFDNYVNAFSVPGYQWSRYFGNSTYVTIISVAGSIAFNSMAGYALARLKFRFRNAIFIVFLTGMMIPPQSIILPQFLIMNGIPLLGNNNWMGQGGSGLLNSLWAIIIPQLCGAFGIFMCRQFYLSFPQSLDDAARIDGCTEFKIYSKIYLPQSTTLLATLTIVKTISVWNDFFYPLIMTTTSDKRTVQLALQVFKGANTSRWNWIMAITLVTILPTLFIFMVAQKYFVQSVASSGMKN
ncbi:MAG: carbohydrate ABC transporter permease [Eubacteriales bacterium]|nr:carbohydrate ABC transporter permease [Eubacteriales bacterium]